MATRTAKNPQANRFVVDLGGVPLTAEEQRSLAAAIQGTVLTFLAPRHPIPAKAIHLAGDAGGGILGMILDLGDSPVTPPRRGRGK